MSASYDLRLVGYTPLGGRIGVIPDLGITVTTAASGPTLTAVVSTAVYGTLPVSLEVGVEYWHSSTQTWTEPRDCRFAITQQAYDDRDPTGTTTLTGIGVGAYLMAAAALAGVEPYVNTTGTSEVAASSTTVSLSNDTFTWPSHIFGDGDRIHITNNGSANKKLKAGLYFVRAPTTNTFKISTTPLGTAKTGMGTANNIHAERVVTRIVFNGSHQFARSSQVLTVGGSALGLSDGTAYYVVNPTAATIQLSSHPGGVPITLSAASTNISQVYRNLDGQRVFTNCHPGTVLSTAFNEAKARGWGVGPTDQVTHGWTTAADSAGIPWASLADDPTTPGVSVGFQPGTPMTTMLQFMLDNQYAEWYTAGRIINVVNYGTGADKTTDGSTYVGTNGISTTPTISLTLGSDGADMQCAVRCGPTGHFFTTQPHTEPDGVTQSTRITRTNSAGVMIDQMVLNGAGHGTSIGIEYTGGVEYVWATWGKPTIAGTTDNNIVRFPWPANVGTAGTRFDRSAVSGLTTVIPGPTYRNVQFDWNNNLAVIRISGGTSDVYQLHPLANVLAGNISAPLNTITLTQSQGFGVDGNRTSQGFCTFKGSLFRYTGAPSDIVGGDPVRLTEYRWSDGAVLRDLNLNGLDKVNGYYPNGKGEPESVTLYDVNGTGPMLYMGIVTGQPGAHGFDLFSLPLNTAIPVPTGGTAPVRIGTTASQLPVTVDLTNIRNSVIVRGTGPILREKDGTAGAWGRLETYETSSGITTKTAADQQALTDIAANGNPQIGYSITEMAQEAAYLPGLHFQRGDWVSVQLAGSGWTTLRVIGWTLAKASNGAITATNVLQYQKRLLVAKALKASVSASAGISDSGTSTSPLLESDNRKPSAPVVSSVTLVGSFNSDDSATCTATVTWAGVTADINGGDITSATYQVWLRPEASDNGAPVGSTAGLTFDLHSLPPGQTYAVSVRAQSDQGAWGEFSNEVEFTTTYATTIPLVPTAPTVTGHLGQARVSWDGNLVDPVNGNVAASDPTQAGFAYVSVWYSTTSSGPWTQIGSNMGNAGAVSISALSIGSTYWFALIATNTLGTSSALSTATSYTIVGVTGPDLVANSVTANTILAGAITADKLDLGTVPAGTQINRIPMPVTSPTYWNLVISNTLPLGPAMSGIQTIGNVSASTSGITLTPTSTVSAQINVTAAKLPVPLSGAIHIALLSTASLAFPQVRWYNAAGTATTVNIAASATGTYYAFDPTAVAYDAKLVMAVGTVPDTIVKAQVFEVLGGGGAGQSAELSPSGLRLFDNNGLLAVDLTTSSQQYLTIYDDTGAEPMSAASIENTGDAYFTSVSSGLGGVDVNGTSLTIVDPTDPGYGDTLDQAQPNGASWVRPDYVDPLSGGNPPVPLLDRLPRGVIYDVSWPSQDGSVIGSTVQYQRIAQDVFVLEHGRSYQFVVQLAGLQTNNTAAHDLYLELQFNTVPNTTVSSGQTVNSSIIYNGSKEAFYLPPIFYSANSNVTNIDFNNRQIPAGVPIYWQLNTVTPFGSPGASVTWAERGGSRGFTIVDMGSSFLTRPVSGHDLLVDVHDYTSTTPTSTGKSGGTTASSKTVTGTATWSATYNNGGGTKITGTGQYNNGSSMYQGLGNTAMGSQFGFSSSFLSQFSGKTITGVQLYLKNNYMGYPNKSALLSTHNAASATSTIGNGRGSNAWSHAYSSGQGQWINVPSAVLTGLSAGTIKGFQLGVDGSGSNYGYFAGAGQSNPPQLKVTFH